MKNLSRNSRVGLIINRLNEIEPFLAPLRELEKEQKSLKVELQGIMGDEIEAVFPGYSITNKWQKRPPIAACEFQVLRYKPVDDKLNKAVKKLLAA